VTNYSSKMTNHNFSGGGCPQAVCLRHDHLPEEGDCQSHRSVFT